MIPSSKLSPMKQPAATAKSINDLVQCNKKQEFEGVPQAVTFNIYPKCQALGCSKSLYFNETSEVFTCDKCNKKYIVSANGLCLKLTVEDEDASSTVVVLFNNQAEKLLNKTAEEILDAKLSNSELYELVKNNRYKFTVQGGRKADEFLCSDFFIVNTARVHTSDTTDHSGNKKDTSTSEANEDIVLSLALRQVQSTSDESQSLGHEPQAMANRREPTVCIWTLGL